MSRQAHFKERLDGRIREIMPLEVGVQVPRCIYTEVPPEGIVRQSAEAFGEVFRKLAEQKECRIEERRHVPSVTNSR